jgi:predicted phosphoadenosine phosphosulfate sulfurtransferase
LINTKKISKLCIKDDIYEIITLPNGFPDETNISDFRHCPSWKAVCITIMKNDFGLTYMSCSRTHDKNNLKQKGMENYRNLKENLNAKSKL